MKRMLLSLSVLAIALAGLYAQTSLKDSEQTPNPTNFLELTFSPPGTIQYYTWGDDDWILTNKVENTYNDSGLEIESIMYHKESGEWEPFSRKVTEYNEQDKVLKTTNYTPQAQQGTGILKSGVIWNKVIETRLNYDEKGTLVKTEGFSFTGESEFQTSGIWDTPTYDGQNRIIENWRQIYSPGPGWQVNRKNVFTWNASNEIMEIEIYIYPGLIPDPINHNLWTLSLKYTVDFWKSFEASEFLPLFSERNVDRSVGNSVIVKDYSADPSGDGEPIRRIEGSLEAGQKDITISHYEDPNWVNDTLVNSIYDAKDNLTEEINSEWDEGGWSVFYKSKFIYSYDGDNLSSIIFQDAIGSSDYVNKNKTEFLDFSTDTDLNSESSENRLLVFPNPSKGNLNIQADKGQIVIISASGQIILEKEITSFNTQVNINDLPKGIYFVNWQNNSKSKSVMVIVH